MQLYLTRDCQTWNVSPYLIATFENHTLRIVAQENVETVYTSVSAEVGESYIVRTFGKQRPPILEKVQMPENRGDKILWALSFVEPEKRASDYLEFFRLQEKVEADYGSTCNIMHYSQGSYAFFVAKRNIKNSKGSKARKSSYKPCLAWCSDTISKKELLELIHKYRRYRKIYCPIDFLLVL